MSLFLVALSAFAVPTQLTHQGRLMDATSGLPLTGTHDVHLAVYAAASGGTPLWEDTQTLPFDEGYFTADLSGVDDTLFDGSTLYLGLTVDSGLESDRITIVSVPYALRSATATSVSGGTVDATSIAIDGTTVIDASGTFVGGFQGQTLGDLTCSPDQVAVYNGTLWTCAAAGGSGIVTWADVATKPAGFDDDVDNDALREIASCGEGQIPQYSATFDAWGCIDLSWDGLSGVPSGLLDGIDDVLTESDVETFVTNGALDLAAGSTIGGSTLVTSWTDLPDIPLALSDGLVDWTEVQNVPLALSDGVVDWTEVQSIPASFADDVDDELSEAEVETFVTNGPLDLALGSRVGTDDIATVADLDFALTNQTCSVGDVVSGIDSSGNVVCETKGGPLDLTGTASCGASSEGTLQYDATAQALEICDGSNWVTVQQLGLLFPFTSHTFTSCGQSGRFGPSIAQCRSSYATSWDENGSYFGMITTGIQRWTVPATGTYRIQAYGAGGGLNTDYSPNYPGRGAMMSGEFDLNQGDVLQILVGQQGTTTQRVGGSGGGTFVLMSDDTPLVVAGGGSGAVRNYGPFYGVADATTGTSGVASGGGNAGGVSGGGGASGGGGHYSGGGGGLTGDGGTGTGSTSGGLSFANDAIGGQCDNSCSIAGAGGFGGGGGGYHDYHAGGGGGFSGGGGGNTGSPASGGIIDNWGGGGGSFNSGANQSNSASVQSGDGQVVITLL